jgi:microcystin-dependent protein
MLKRFMLALFTTLGLAAPALAAGTIPLSLSQQFDSQGVPLAGCLLYTIQAGTTSTPQSAFQDSGLTLALPNPMTCDASGRLPQFFLGDGSIKVRLTDKTGVTVLVADNILVIGPSVGGGSGAAVDATTVLATGDIKTRYGTGPLTGFVRANGRTIGSATSGATERANADAQPLFEYLWNTDAALTVSGGRGASSTADFLANKTITLPDWRGRVIAGLDDMGNSAAGRLTSTYFGTTATNLGAASGLESAALVQGNLPSVAFPLSGTAVITPSTVVRNTTLVNISNQTGATPTVSNVLQDLGTADTFPINLSPVTALSGGSSTPFRTVQPTMLASIYLKL